jgi:hypothetical protein
MISVHRIRSFKAFLPFPEANWLRLTMTQLNGDSCEITFFVDVNCGPWEEGTPPPPCTMLVQLADAINSVPTANEVEAALVAETAKTAVNSDIPF